MARPLVYDTKILVKLTNNQLNSLKTYCEKNKITMTDFVRQSIEEKQEQIEVEVKTNFNNMKFEFN